MFSLVVFAALGQPPIEPALPGGMPPTQMLASMDAKGKLTLTWVATAGAASYEQNVPVPTKKGTDKGPATAKVKLTHLMVTTAEMSAEHVEAVTAGGRPVSREQLATLLAKERAVLVVLDGKKVDPFYLRLYKEDALILVPPANALGGGGATSYSSAGIGATGVDLPLPGPAVAPVPVPADRPVRVPADRPRD
jgi:hypothetical protein